MTCKCGKNAHDPNCDRPEHSVSAVELADARTYPNLASCEERIRLLTEDNQLLRREITEMSMTIRALEADLGVRE